MAFCYKDRKDIDKAINEAIVNANIPDMIRNIIIEKVLNILKCFDIEKQANIYFTRFLDKQVYDYVSSYIKFISEKRNKDIYKTICEKFNISIEK